TGSSSSARSSSSTGSSSGTGSNSSAGSSSGTGSNSGAGSSSGPHHRQPSESDLSACGTGGVCRSSGK
ncbi:hypothetical protein FH501_11980, partial [Klebsiella pneumoniae]